MKASVILLAMICISIASSSYAFERPIGVDLYPSGARFKFRVRPDEKGQIEATLPGSFMENSVREVSSGNVGLHVEAHPRTQWVPVGLEGLSQEIDGQVKVIDELTAKKLALEQTLRFLQDMKPDKGSGEELLRYMIEAQELRLRTENELSDLKKQLNLEDEKLSVLNKELTSRRPRGDTSYIALTGRASQPVEFEAFTPSATWNTKYIMDMDSKTGDIRVRMYVQASQRTGLDYEGKMTLHTKAPDENITTPELSAQTVRIAPKEKPIAALGNVKYAKTNRMLVRSGIAAEEGMAVMDEEPELDDDDDEVLPSRNDTLLDRSIYVNGKLTGDGRKSEYEVIRDKGLVLKSSPDIVLIPEKRSNAWIIANMDPSNERLIPGQAELRVDGNPSGKIYVQEYAGQRKVPFGYIDQITIKKEALVGVKGVSWFSGVQTSGYKLEITNGTNDAHVITVIDRLPIPTDEKIKLEVKRIDPAPKEKDKENRCTWQIEVPSGGSANIIVDYTLSYPSGEELSYGTK